MVPIGSVHRQDQIECLEVFLSNTPGAFSADVYSAKAQSRLGTLIGRVTDMPTSEAGRIDDEILAKSSLNCDIPKDPFGNRRAADITEANEKNPFL